jgi:hypothetical protein
MAMLITLYLTWYRVQVQVPVPVPPPYRVVPGTAVPSEARATPHPPPLQGEILDLERCPQYPDLTVST